MDTCQSSEANLKWIHTTRHTTVVEDLLPTSTFRFVVDKIDVISYLVFKNSSSN